MNSNGYTALYYATMKGHMDVIQFLLEKTGNLVPLDRFGNNILHVASLFGQSEVIKDQLQNTDLPSINRTELDGRTPLFNAAMRGHSETFGLLVLHSTDVNVRDRYNSSALFTAVRNQHLEVIRQLLAVDQVALDYIDCFGLTVFSWAYRSRNLKVIELMELTATQMGFEIQNHMDMPTPLEGCIFDSEASWCDVCTRCIQLEVKYFECKECVGFVVCSECATTGVRCRENSHEWVSQHNRSNALAHDKQ